MPKKENEFTDDDRASWVKEKTEKPKRTRKVNPKYITTHKIKTETERVNAGTTKIDVYEPIKEFTEKDESIKFISDSELAEGEYFVFQIIAKSTIATEKTVKVEK